MRQLNIVLALAAALLLGGIGGADAQPMPKPQTQGGITFISGGVGLASEQYMDSLQRDYSLHVLFVQLGTGAFFANLIVQIVDNASAKTILNTVSPGPMFFAKLKPGSYSVTSSHAGKPVTKNVVVPAEGAAELFCSSTGPDDLAHQGAPAPIGAVVPAPGAEFSALRSRRPTPARRAWVGLACLSPSATVTWQGRTRP
jgi:hypothetical protein